MPQILQEVLICFRICTVKIYIMNRRLQLCIRDLYYPAVGNVHNEIYFESRALVYFFFSCVRMKGICL